MEETSAEDRLARLLGGKLPELVVSDEPSFAEQELQAMEERNNRWRVPEVAQYPRKVGGQQAKSAAGGDVFTSSDDDDDYTSAFQRKPKMISKTTKKTVHQVGPRKMPEAGAFGHDQSKVLKLGAIAYVDGGRRKQSHNSEDEQEASLPTELPQNDDQGNKAIGHFCQLGLVIKFPYKYMVDENDRVSKHFFANQKIYERKWNLYFLHGPESSYLTKPLLLIPYHQVKVLIDEISSAFKVDAKVPPFPFTISFFDDGTPQPVHLGTTMSRADINDLQDSIPAPTEGHGEPPAKSNPALDHSFAAFKAKVERAQAAEKRKKAAIKKKKANDRFLNIQDWCKQLRRAQRYLGVRPEPYQAQPPPDTLSWDEQSEWMKEQEKKAGTGLDSLDVTKPAPHNFYQTPVIVAVDIESYERAHEIITEVGISTLDTLDLVDLPIGEGGEEWMKQIRSRHFRIKGREHYINKDFCIGDGNAFQFGNSEWVDVDKVGDLIDSCFEWPFSVQYKHDGKLKYHSESWDDTVKRVNTDFEKTQGQVNGTANNDAFSMVTHINGHANVNGTAEPAYTNKQAAVNITPINLTDLQKGPKERTLLFCGHDIKGDLTYLSQLNSAIFNTPRPDGAAKYPPTTTVSISLVDTTDPRARKGAEIVDRIADALDTGTLYKVLLKESNPRSLTSMMADLGRSAFYSHNGGNDARYTLEALIGLIIKARLMDDEAEKAKQAVLSAASPWETEKASRISEKARAAADEVKEELEAWERAGATGTSSPTGSPTAPQEEFISAMRNGQYEGKENVVVDDAWGSSQTFKETLGDVHKQQDKKKKSAEMKRREWEMRVRKEDGIQGPCDWAVGGKDGVGK